MKKFISKQGNLKFKPNANSDSSLEEKLKITLLGYSRLYKLSVIPSDFNFLSWVFVIVQLSLKTVLSNKVFKYTKLM